VVMTGRRLSLSSSSSLSFLSLSLPLDEPPEVDALAAVTLTAGAVVGEVVGCQAA
jgi:hypothetical protein